METFAEYERLARMTQPTNGCDAIRHGAHGLSSELGELGQLVLEAQCGRVDCLHILEEGGDLLWYTVRVLTGLGVTLEQAVMVKTFFRLEHDLSLLDRKTTLSLTEIYLILCPRVAALHDALKRELAYAKQYHPTSLVNACGAIVTALAHLASWCGYSLEAVAKANIAKLANRSEALRADPALRDLNFERQVMADAAGAN